MAQLAQLSISVQGLPLHRSRGSIMIQLYFQNKHNEEADIHSLTLCIECSALDSILGYPIVFYWCTASSMTFQCSIPTPGIATPISIDLLTLL